MRLGLEPKNIQGEIDTMNSWQVYCPYVGCCSIIHGWRVDVLVTRRRKRGLG